MELLNDGVWRASWLVNTSVCQKGARPTSKETEAPALRTLPRLTLPLTISYGYSPVSFIISFDKL